MYLSPYAINDKKKHQSYALAQWNLTNNCYMVKYQFNPIHGASGDKLSLIYYSTEKILIYF